MKLIKWFVNYGAFVSIAAAVGMFLTDNTTVRTVFFVWCTFHLLGLCFIIEQEKRKTPGGGDDGGAVSTGSGPVVTGERPGG